MKLNFTFSSILTLFNFFTGMKRFPKLCVLSKCMISVELFAYEIKIGIGLMSILSSLFMAYSILNRLPRDLRSIVNYCRVTLKRTCAIKALKKGHSCLVLTTLSVRFRLYIVRPACTMSVL